jgi:hypothetical protein
MKRCIDESSTPTSPIVANDTKATNSSGFSPILRDSYIAPVKLCDWEAERLRESLGVNVAMQFSDDRSPTRRACDMRYFLDRSGIPRRHREMSRGNLVFREPWAQCLKKVLNVVLDRGMVALIGSPGSGKTQIAVEAIRANLIQNAKPVRYEVLEDVFALCREAYSTNATRSEMQLIRDFTSPDFLVIDEIDKKASRENAQRHSNEQRLLHRILDKRYREMRPTLLIGNVANEDYLQELLDGFAGEGIGPLFDRLRQTGGIVKAFGWSFRDKAGENGNAGT